MSASTLPNTLMRFADFEADLRACRLHKHGIRLKLFKQSFDVLVILLEHAGDVVTRDELRRRLWPDDVLVDFDNNLNTAVARLREALGDAAGQPRFIETVPRCGYRFLAPVSVASKPRLLVLPFANPSGDPTQAYLSDAVTDEMISRLAGLAPEHLAVIARTTALHYKRSPKDIAQIGRELAIDYVVEGSIRRTQDRIAATVQLVEVRNQTHLWANRYDADWSEVFNVWDAAAKAIAERIGITPRRATRKPTEDLQAYALYLQGRYELHKMTPASMLKAKQCLDEAIERDRRFALAYDALGELHWYLGFLGVMPPRQASSIGVLAAMRALELDNTLAETHALLGWFRKELDYNWPEVYREMSRALELNPTSAVVRYRYGRGWFCPQGLVLEGATEIEAALELDPLSMDMRFWLAVMLWLGHEYDRAIEEARRMLQLDPAYTPGYYIMAMCFRDMGQFDEAIAAGRRAVELSGCNPVTLACLGFALAQSGNVTEPRAILEQLHLAVQKAYVPPTSLAWIHFGLGEIDDAFTWMDRAIDVRDHMMTPIKTYPFLDPFRSDPRYLALLRRMNLEP